MKDKLIGSIVKSKRIGGSYGDVIKKIFPHMNQMRALSYEELTNLTFYSA
jgi:hypothetical protein